MNTTKHFFLITTLCLISISISATNDIIFLKNNKATITIDDHIKHPLYWWPKTLLTYEINSENKIPKNELILTDQFTHEQITIQITKIKPNQSGGEKAFTAIALLFAILKINPAPFCVLDEIEAALDDVNVYRFAEYLKKFSKETQFLVITHRKGTMEAADTVYGVTMEENGISKLLSIKLA